MKKHLFFFCCILALSCNSGNAAAVNTNKLFDSMHNLSTSGPGEVKVGGEEWLCKFCHAPHAWGQVTPLWQAYSNKSVYITYKSTSLKSAVGQPNGASKLCLACHDGTIALGMLRGGVGEGPKSARMMTKMPPGPANLGIDLSDDHPISFVYDSTIEGLQGQLVHPNLLDAEVKLDEYDRIQCTTCHDAHDNRYGKFLVMDNSDSKLCIACHQISSWQISVHRNSAASWNNVPPDPWTHTEGVDVAANACENCHRPHSAGGRERLLNYAAEEDNCYPCHNGNVSQKDIRREFEKPYRHPIGKTIGVHKPGENPLAASRHVECEDCHNPHAANPSQAQAPNIPGSLAELGGISTAGTPVKPLQFEYELCYRCHSDNPGSKKPFVNRHIFEKDQSRKFDAINASFHPVETVGRNGDVPSLKNPLNVESMIYCIDCHNSDESPQTGGTGPNGPHGSIWEPILERQYIIADGTMESLRAYALCYKCHDRRSILADESFPLHKLHIVDDKTPCSVCHDAHGVKDNTNLVNFDKSLVEANRKGLLSFSDNGKFSGGCNLKCHGVDHDMNKLANDPVDESHINGSYPFIQK